MFALFEVSATWVTKGVSQRQSNQTEHIMRPSINKLINIVFCVFCTCAFCMQPPELPEQWISRVVHMDENLSCLGQNRWQVSLCEFRNYLLRRWKGSVVNNSQHSSFSCFYWWTQQYHPSKKTSNSWMASLRTREAWWVEFESLARHFCALDRAELWQRAFVLDSGAKSLRADPSVRNSVWHTRLTYDTWHTSI